MDIIYAYAGTISLESELISVDINEIEIGDLFIQGGSPGHAVIVVDMAFNETTGGKIIFISPKLHAIPRDTDISKSHGQGLEPVVLFKL